MPTIVKGEICDLCLVDGCLPGELQCGELRNWVVLRRTGPNLNQIRNYEGGESGGVF